VVEGRTAEGLSVYAISSDDFVTDTTRVVPRHVAQNRLNTRNVVIPKGYKSVWTDGRLNPHRAEQTLAGREQMLLVWTNTVPRRLVNTANGRDVTASVPLVYPYTSIAQQRRAQGEVKIVQRNGKTVTKVIQTQPVARKPTYSSRSAQQPARARTLAGER
jgi:hypothetical protein